VNFFEQQARARRQSQHLLVLFALAVLAIVVAMNGVVLLLSSASAPADPRPMLSAPYLFDHWRAPVVTTTLTLAVIGLGLLIRSTQLRGGGRDIAHALGGDAVDPSTREPTRRRLYHIVEEMAVASGMPVPGVFVLEQEGGINAFAAGYTPLDAALTVTRGALDLLSRDELQGLVAHEFSHIINGDMRLNVRLIGVLYGILSLSILGRRGLRMLPHLAGARLGRGTPAALGIYIGVFVLAWALVIVGSIGLLLGSWLQANVARQREFLADAAAVQFTRNPAGVGGVLKKIAASPHGSFLLVDACEVGHMLFAPGLASRFFATHPPLEQRIRAVDPSFRPAELPALREQLRDRRLALRPPTRQRPEVTAFPAAPDATGPTGTVLSTSALLDSIGQAHPYSLAAAIGLLSSLPLRLRQQARSEHWAREVICTLLLSTTPALRDRQLLLIATSFGAEFELRVRQLAAAWPQRNAGQRLAVLELALPTIARLPAAARIVLRQAVDQLARIDGNLSAVDYALSRLVRRDLTDLLHPRQARFAGDDSVRDHAALAIDLLQILAHHGHSDDTAAAEEALNRGLAHLLLPLSDAPIQLPTDWPARLDRALIQLDRLGASAKQELVEAMLLCVTANGLCNAEELHLIRVFAAALHIPVPLLARALEGTTVGE